MQHKATSTNFYHFKGRLHMLYHHCRMLFPATCFFMLMLVMVVPGLAQGAVISIESIEELQKIGADPGYPLNGQYVLGNDIDASRTRTWNDNGTGGFYGFAPIGPNSTNDSTTRFTGSFNGQGHTITGLYINRPQTYYIALFGVIDADATVDNITMIDSEIQGNYFVGCLTGFNYGSISGCSTLGTVTGATRAGGLAGANAGTITGCYSSGAVRGTLSNRDNNIGGLTGYNNGGSISNSSTAGTVNGSNNNIGGLVGLNVLSPASTIFNCSSSAAVSGPSNVGGLVGFHMAGSITTSYSSGTVTGTTSVGGLIGNNASSTSDCYSSATVTASTASNYVGGLVGYNTSSITRCYSSGSVSGNLLPIAAPGGLVGANSGTASNCFWDTQTSGWATSAAGTGKTTAEMKIKSMFTSAGWNFTTIWGIINTKTYPFFRGANDGPVAVADSYTTIKNIPLSIAAPGVLDNDTDADGDSLTAVLVSSSVHGHIDLHADGSFMYTPDGDFAGFDSFTYRAFDGSAYSAPVSVAICVEDIYYRDADGDGYGNAAATTLACSQPAGYVTGSTDCNDSNSATHPGASDANCNGVDDDCDGTTDENYVSQATSCGVGACARTGSTSCVGGSEVDSCTPGTPAASDTTCDGIDDDCNGLVDDGYVSQGTSCGVGVCAATGSTSCVAGQVQNSCTPGLATGPDTNCNGLDEDCDGTADNHYVSQLTSCGVGACAAMGMSSCVGGSVQENCSPGAPSEEVCDGIDNDCDGVVDNGLSFHFYYEDLDNDTYGNALKEIVACQQPEGYVDNSSGFDCNDNDSTVYPGAADAMCNGVDDNCNGQTDEDYVSQPTTCGTGACAATGSTSCVGGVVHDSCVLGQAGIETCNGIDDDCDGNTDEDIAPIPITCGVGACAATGSKTCQGGVMVDSCTPGAPSQEVCDGIDNNCNGATDEGGVCVTTTTTSIELCPAPVLNAPSGAGYTPKPTFTWRQIGSEAWYNVVVWSEAAGGASSLWVGPTACTNGGCSATFNNPLTPGNNWWWLNIYYGENSCGFREQPGGAGLVKAFTVVACAGPTLTSPNGDTFAYGTKPNFVFSDSGAEYYNLQAWSSAGYLSMNQWEDAAGICSAGSCHKVSNNFFPAGTNWWWLNTWSQDCGFQMQPGGWVKAFTVQ